MRSGSFVRKLGCLPKSTNLRDDQEMTLSLISLCAVLLEKTSDIYCKEAHPNGSLFYDKKQEGLELKFRLIAEVH
jgi:hypothetical protein